MVGDRRGVNGGLGGRAGREDGAKSGRRGTPTWSRTVKYVGIGAKGLYQRRGADRGWRGRQEQRVQNAQLSSGISNWTRSRGVAATGDDEDLR